MQTSNSGDMGLSFKQAIAKAADRTRTGTTRTPAADETIAKLTENKGRFGVPPETLQQLQQQQQQMVEQGDSEG